MDLQAPNAIKFNKDYVINATEIKSKNITKATKSNCKVLEFSSEWNFEDLLTFVDKLETKEYPSLFIFIIKAKQGPTNDKIEEIKKKLLKFGSARPLVLQITSEDNNSTTLCYTEDDLSKFITVDQAPGSIEDIKDFPSFLRAFSAGNLTNSEAEILDVLSGLQNRSLILRFLRVLVLNDDFLWNILLQIASKGIIAEFLAALDVKFEKSGSTLNNGAYKYIFNVFGDNQDQAMNKSALLTAVENQNKDVIDYLIDCWYFLIQQLPFEHQVRISTAAFDTNQLDVLCRLLNIADFPFPKDFNHDLIVHEGLRDIIDKRLSFATAISTENNNDIKEFIDTNQDLKVAYNINNKSALKQAVDASKINIYVLLKSSGFCSKNKNEDFKEARKYEAQQRNQNMNEGLIDDKMSINSLCNRSRIHNKKIDKKQEEKYRKNIRSWYKDISKIKNGTEFLKVAASCSGLKLLFDFENNTVENASMDDAGALGIIYPIKKWIFIGAKLADEDGKKTKERKQTIKGVLAHELCHYVMKLVYDNQEMPYYEDSEDIKNKFKAIVKTINKWTAKDPKCPDDECNGIISSVFTAYKVKDFHPELIVRVVQILSNFDDSEEKLKHLELKYKVLFDFWFNQVVPDLQKYIQRNGEVIRLNESIKLLPKIFKHKIKVKHEKNISELIDSKLVIVSTNHPQLLFIDICQKLKEKFGNLMDSNNLFVVPLELKDQPNLRDFQQICLDNQDLSIFVDCTSGVPDDLENIFTNKEFKFTFVVSTKQQIKELDKICRQKELENVTRLDINYSWKDLTEGSQTLMLKTKINFQNNSQITLLDLVVNKIEAEEPATSTAVENDKEDISDLVNEQLLNLVLENHQVLINSNENDDKNFDLLYKKRGFVKKVKITAKNVEDEDSEEEKSKRLLTKKNRNIFWTTPNKPKNINLFRRNIKGEQISQEKLLEESKNQQYVLISDQAGNGKSWEMKNLSKTLIKENPTSWVSYVDLKQFIDQFKAQKAEPDFSYFMIEHILKPQQQFEAKIFQKLYKDGRVFILFDGFDEIAPNYAEFVSKLAQNFQQNGGNQLWIATRDYFEVDLMEKLKLNVAYSLKEMTEYDEIDLIAKSWLLMDLQKDNNEPKSKKEFDKFIKSSPKYENYWKKARKIIKKAEISRYNSVGLPQMLKMIAVGFKDEENVDDLQGIKIYAKFLDILYKRWSQGKGQIRDEANVKSQRFKLSFYNFHQFKAILSLFPELAEILFPNYDDSEWPQEEVIAGAVMSINDGKIYFPHETFREYFVADAIAIAVKNSKIDEKVVEIFVEILTVKKFEIIRMFLNDMIDVNSILPKIKEKVLKHKKLFYEMSKFSYFFTNNLTNWVNLVLEILKTGSYEQVKEILQNSAEDIAANTADSKVFLKYQNFIFVFLKIDDLKTLILKSYVLQGIIGSGLKIEIFEDFVTKTEEKTDRKFIRQGLMVKRSDRHKGNIFYFLTQSTNLSAQKVQKLLKIMEKFFTATEIFRLMSKFNVHGENILQVCVQEKNEEKLKILWTEIEKYFEVQNLAQTFKELVKQQNRRGKENILHYAAYCNKIEVHETLWELMLKTFEDRDELEDLILQVDKINNNFVHELVEQNKNPAIIELTFKNLKEKFSDHFQEILTPKGFWKMNLLQAAAIRLKVIEIHQFLWKFFRDFCGTDEKFLEMLKEVDKNRENILQVNARWNSSSEIFEFMIQELEKITSPVEIRQMLRNLNDENQNLLQPAARRNKSSEFHKTLWKTLRKYFEKLEISQFIKNVDIRGNNLLFTLYGDKPTKEIVELTWNEIKSFLAHDEQVEYLKMKGENGRILLEHALYSTEEEELHQWVQSLMQEYGIAGPLVK
ncbi:hypothetical protein ACKWTF_014702 [Chironomus riparius]